MLPTWPMQRESNWKKTPLSLIKNGNTLLYELYVTEIFFHSEKNGVNNSRLLSLPPDLVLPININLIIDDLLLPGPKDTVKN